MKGNIEIRVRETTFLENIRTGELPKWKKLIAKWLRIPIAPLFFYKIKVILNHPDSIGIGDICLYGGWTFQCISKNGSEIELDSTGEMHDNFNPMTSLIIPLYNAFPEGCGERSN